MLALAAAPAAAAGPPPDSSWTPLAALPEANDSPVFALASSPSDPSLVLVGTASGAIFRSTDFGGSWQRAKSGLGRGVVAIAFSPLKPAGVLAGSRGGGVWRSGDGGATWAAATGLPPGTSARSFGFSKGYMLAGTDRGVFTSSDGAAWTASGLTQLSVDALAVAAINDPIRVLAGADATRTGEPLPAFISADGATSWKPLTGPATTSNVVSALAAGPLAPGAAVRPLLMGTNGGLFASADNGGRWDQVTGAGVLPATDYSAVAFSSRAERYYVASDGGGSSRGGLWVTPDSGQHFSSLQPPLPAVTALAVSADEQPYLYVAGFRPADHAAMLWLYHDTGGIPVPPVNPPAAGRPRTPAAEADSAPAALGSDWLRVLSAGPEGPYLAIGVGAVLVVMLALVAYARRSRF